MEEEERQKILSRLWEEQKRILGETKDNIGVFVTEEQLVQRRKLLFDLHLKSEYLGFEKVVNKKTPFVSVCIPTYQHKNYIEECINGALMQKTTFPFEIIICDDGSTDGTTEICKTYAERHKDKIRLFNHNRAMTRLFDSNGKIKSVHNWWWTLETARGKYIAICEGDDFWVDPLKLQKQVDFLEKNIEYGLVHTNYNCINGKDENVLKINRNWMSGDVCNLILEGKYYIATLTTLFRTELLNNYDNALYIKYHIGDLPMWLEFSYQSKFKYIDEITSTYRILEESSSHSEDIKKTYYFQQSCIEIKSLFAKNKKLKFSQKKALNNKYKSILKDCFLKKKSIEAKHFYKLLLQNSWLNIFDLKSFLFMSVSIYPFLKWVVKFMYYLKKA